MAALAVAALMGTALSAARAGTYDVYACNTAARAFANHAWMLYVTAGDFIARDCDLSDSDPQMLDLEPDDQTYGVYRGAR